MDEKILDLRERRLQRREHEQEARDDRASNVIGTTGLALNATALLLVISGSIFATALTTFAWFEAILAIPLVLVGLPVSFIGALRPGRLRYLSWIGVVMGALLLVILIPAMMMLLLRNK